MMNSESMSMEPRNDNGGGPGGVVDVSCKSELLFRPNRNHSTEASPTSSAGGSNKLPRHLRSVPVKTIVHPMDQSIAGSFCLSVVFVAVAMVTGLPLVAALLVLLPVALGLRYVFASCCLYPGCRDRSSRNIRLETAMPEMDANVTETSRRDIEEAKTTLTGGQRNDQINSSNCRCCLARTKLVSAFDGFWLKGFLTKKVEMVNGANANSNLYPNYVLGASTELRPGTNRGQNAVNSSQFVAHCLFYLESGVSAECVRELVKTRIIQKTCEDGSRAFARFTQRVVSLSAGYVWDEDPHFSMEWHVRQEQVRVARTRQLRLYMAYLMKQGLQPDRPLWEIRVLPHVGRAKSTVLVLRVHHALSDGVALVKVLANALTDHSHLLRLKPRFGGATFPLNVFRALVVGPLTFLCWLLSSRADYNLFRHNQPVSGDRVIAWSKDIRLSKIQRIKQITRSTVNDVFVAAITGSVRTYFRNHGIVHPPDVTVSLPVDLRYEPSSPESVPDLTNGYALVTCSLPTNTEGSIPRLWEVRHRMEDLKTSADPVVMYGAVNFLLTLLPETIGQWLLEKVQGKSSVSYCNLPGPEEPILLGTHRIKRMIFWMAARPEVPVSFSVCTYAGACCVALSADRDVIPDGKVLITDVVAQIERLSRLLSKRRIPGEHRRRSSFTAERRQEEIFKPSVPEIQVRLHRVQDELHEITQRLELASMRPEECAFAFNGQRELSQTSKALLCRRVEELKEEFSELLTELRRRKSAIDGSLLEDEDQDGELRRPRRRALSSASNPAMVGLRRASMTSVSAITPLMSTSRPLTTPNIAHHRRPPLLSSSSPSNSPGPVYTLVNLAGGGELMTSHSEINEPSSPGSQADQQRALLSSVARIQFSRRHSDFGSHGSGAHLC